MSEKKRAAVAGRNWRGAKEREEGERNLTGVDATAVVCEGERGED